MEMSENRLESKSWLRVLLGLGLLFPAAVCCLCVLVLPTLGTIVQSLFDTDMMTAPSFVGGDNYTQLFQDQRFSEALGFTLSSAAVRVAVVAFVPLLLALAVNEFGRVVRIPVRLLFTIPLALFAPVVTALVWRLALDPRGNLMSTLLRGLGMPPQSLLADPESARRIVLSIDGLTTFGLACGLGLILYLAALRGRGADAPSWKAARKPLIVSWVVGLLATIALVPQSFVLSFALTRGGPAGSTMMLALYQYMMSLTRFRFGVGAALSTLSLTVMILCGLGVGLLGVFTGLRLERVSWGKEVGLITRGGRRKAIAILLILAMVFVSCIGCLLSILPRMWNVVASFGSSGVYTQALEGPAPVSIGMAWVNTVLPAFLVILLFQMPITYVAALGIGALRPLQKRSEWLLLLFSPWLFVTIAPHTSVAFLVARQLKLADTVVALLLPSLFSVPILFILTLFFKGQEPRWRAALVEGQSPVKAFFSTLILPSLPLTTLLAFGSLLITMQDLLWPLVILVSPSKWTMPMVLTYLSGSPNPMPVLMASTVLFGLPVFLFFFLVFGLFQAFYLDRLALVAGKRDDAEPLDEPSPPEVDALDEAVVTEISELEEERKTVRLEMEGTEKTVRLEAEEAKTVRLEPEGARETVRLEPEGAKKTVRLEPEGAKKTVRLEPEEAKTVRLRPEGEREDEREDERKTVRLEMEDEGKTVRLEREEDDDAQA
jgi:ABC-type sugar transport system permease subunit